MDMRAARRRPLSLRAPPRAPRVGLTRHPSKGSRVRGYRKSKSKGRARGPSALSTQQAVDSHTSAESREADLYIIVSLNLRRRPIMEHGSDGPCPSGKLWRMRLSVRAARCAGMCLSTHDSGSLTPTHTHDSVDTGHLFFLARRGCTTTSKKNGFNCQVRRMLSRCVDERLGPIPARGTKSPYVSKYALPASRRARSQITTRPSRRKSS